MDSTLAVLALLAAVLGLRSLLRRGRNRARPIFQQNDIFAGRLTEGLLHALVSDRGYVRTDTRVAGFLGSAIIIDRDGACGRLILCPALAPSGLPDGLPSAGQSNDLPGLRALAARHASDRSPTIVVVGGSATFGGSAFAATAPLRTLHIDDRGEVREIRRGFRSKAPRLVIESALDRMAKELEEGAFPALDFETARNLVSFGIEGERRSGPPLRGVVTSALTVAIIVCFVAEVAISRDALRGDGATLSIAYRMGAIHQSSILAGEWPRLLAAPFLHFGMLHLAMNGWAQWSLGVPIEFLVGPWRFLALWAGSALGASLTSLLFNDSSVSAGASGAIFGLLGAFTTFVFFRKDVLPQPVPSSLRNGVLATLLLNLLISFIPGIDMAAHAGGFVTGAIMAFGLVRRDAAARPPAARSPSLRLAVTAIVLAGVGLTSVQKRADLTVRAPQVQSEYQMQELRLPIPDRFTVSESKDLRATTIEAEGGPASPFAVAYRISEPQTDRQAALDILKGLRAARTPGATSDSDWIAVSQLGVQGTRVIQIEVTAPASAHAEAKKLVAELARLIR